MKLSRELRCGLLGALLVVASSCTDGKVREPTAESRTPASDEAGAKTVLPGSDAVEWYSGSFVVRNHFGRDVQIARWNGFEIECPAEGILVADAEAFTHFPRMESFPNSTAVTWSEYGEEQSRTQLLELASVVPLRTEGMTVFELDAKGMWTVAFVIGKVD